MVRGLGPGPNTNTHTTMPQLKSPYVHIELTAADAVVVAVAQEVWLWLRRHAVAATMLVDVHGGAIVCGVEFSAPKNTYDVGTLVDGVVRRIVPTAARADYMNIVRCEKDALSSMFCSHRGASRRIRDAVLEQHGAERHASTPFALLESIELIAGGVPSRMAEVLAAIRRGDVPDRTTVSNAYTLMDKTFTAKTAMALPEDVSYMLLQAEYHVPVSYCSPSASVAAAVSRAAAEVVSPAYAFGMYRTSEWVDVAPSIQEAQVRVRRIIKIEVGRPMFDLCHPTTRIEFIAADGARTPASLHIDVLCLDAKDGVLTAFEALASLRGVLAADEVARLTCGWSSEVGPRAPFINWGSSVRGLEVRALDAARPPVCVVHETVNWVRVHNRGGSPPKYVAEFTLQ